MEDHNNFLDSNGDEEEIGSKKKDQKLESAKGEIGEVKEENKRLKFLLARLVNDYQLLQMNFFDILQQDKPKEATKATCIATNNNHGENEESELVLSLSLGKSSQGRPASMEEKEDSNRTEKREDEDVDKGLALGLDIRFDPVDQTEAANNPGPQSSLDYKRKEEEPTEMWPPSKVLKTMKIGDESEASHQLAQLKKARVSIRARCDSQTMNDGCQWRKYGQKIAKGNPCPRAYYRCTGSPSCPVRKQVQRCAEDMSILITTYEGNHNHPLHVSATAMASTTSAAASMLQSPSLSSQQGLGNSDIAPIINSSPAHNPYTLNFSKYQISRPHQFYFPSSSISTLNAHPTITLDLTAPPTSSHFSYIPKYPSTNLNFSSGFSPLQSSMPQSPWSSYSGIGQIRNQDGYALNTGKQPSQGHHQYQPIYISNRTISQQSSPDPIVAATKTAITTIPKFQSVLATVLTTYVANGAAGGGRLRENHTLRSAALNLKLTGGDLSNTCNDNSIGCAPSSRYLNMSSSALNSQQGKSIVFPLPVSKNASGSSSSRSNQLLEQYWK